MTSSHSKAREPPPAHFGQPEAAPFIVTMAAMSAGGLPMVQLLAAWGVSGKKNHPHHPQPCSKPAPQPLALETMRSVIVSGSVLSVLTVLMVLAGADVPS